MLKYFKGSELDGSGFAEKVWSFRHRHFVERFGWEALRKPDAREIDQFDDEEAIHLVLEDAGLVIGYSRLLRTDIPHLLSDIYPELADGCDYQTGPRILEWTRCVAEPGALLSGVEASHILLTGVLEFCLSAGIDALIVETHPKLVNLLVSNQWDVMPIAAPKVYDGALVLPIHAVPSVQALLSHHRNTGINGSVLDLGEGSRNPVDGGVLSSFVTHRHVARTEEKRYA